MLLSLLAHCHGSARAEPQPQLTLALVLLALQNSLIYHGKQLSENQLSQSTAQQLATPPMHVQGGGEGGGVARGAPCSTPGVDRIGIRG